MIALGVSALNVAQNVRSLLTKSPSFKTVEVIINFLLVKTFLKEQ